MLVKGKFNITIDGQFGSTGKGLLNSYLAENSAVEPDICITNAAPNAGHTYVDENGKKRTTFHLPITGVLLPMAEIYLCAGSIIDPDLLIKECEMFDVDPARVSIHPHACILTEQHQLREKATNSGATSISSTQKGVGAALADKVARQNGQVAKDCQKLLEAGFVIENIDLNEMFRIADGYTAMMEVPQGFGLSINHGPEYPYCTSRDITVAAALNDAGVHPCHLGSVGVSLRTFPIRVGNIKDENGVEVGYSGPFYPDSTETTWEQLGQEPELTTVTKRVRRVATFSLRQYQDMVEMLRPDYVFLNFCNYFDEPEDFEVLVSQMAKIDLQVMGKQTERLFGFGPANSDVVAKYNDAVAKYGA